MSDIIEIENRFLEVSSLKGVLSKFPLVPDDIENIKIDKEKSDQYGEVFTPLWLVDKMILEGAKKEISTNIYERNPIARQKCLDHYGYSCTVCDKVMSDIYGEVAKYIIEVHHVKPLSEINKQYIINPIEDLKPICPDCHTIIHLKTPCYTIEEIKEVITTKIKN